MLGHDVAGAGMSQTLRRGPMTRRALGLMLVLRSKAFEEVPMTHRPEQPSQPTPPAGGVRGRSHSGSADGGAMADTVELDELVARYRRERAPGEPPYRTAASVLARAGDRLDGATGDYLVFGGRSIFEQKGISPEVHLSPPLADAIASGTRYFLTRSAILARERCAGVRPDDDAAIDRPDDERAPIALVTWGSDVPGRRVSRMAVPASDLLALMAEQLVKTERVRGLHEGLAAGTLSPRALTEDEYADYYGLNDAGWAQIFATIGWLPSLLVASLAASTVALVSGARCQLPRTFVIIRAAASQAICPS